MREIGCELSSSAFFQEIVEPLIIDRFDETRCRFVSVPLATQPSHPVNSHEDRISVDAILSNGVRTDFFSATCANQYC